MTDPGKGADEGRAPAAAPYSARRLGLLFAGCFVLGCGVTLLLRAALGSDGYSTLVNGIAIATGMPFLLANTLVSLTFIGVAWARALRPGLGTLVQIVVVGGTVSAGLEVLDTPDSLWARSGLLVLAFPVLAVGIAAYLGSHTGAGPAEGAALAWDPPLPFRWSYSLIQGGGALAGWLLGAAAGVGTLAVVLVLGPAVDLASRLLGLTVEQGAAARSRSSADDTGPGRA